jgi:hypothetical protein
VEADVSRAQDPEEGLPPLPRRHGVLIESGLGAMGQLGELRHVSPLSPRFFLRAGYELVPWFLLFAEGDVAFSNTSYATHPPPSRGYSLFGMGAGLRFTLDLSHDLAAYVQGSTGLARVDQDVLTTYGYGNANSFNEYFAGLLGLQIYLPSPHLRLLIEGGVRNHPQGLKRSASSATPMVWLAEPALAYAF